MASSSLTWGPYKNQNEAAACLGRFASEAVGPGIGVIWCEAGGAALLRPPSYGADDLGLTLIARSLGPVAREPADGAPRSTWERIEQVVGSVFVETAMAEIRLAEAEAAAGQAAAQKIEAGWRSINEFIEGHEVATGVVAVGFDAVGVLAGVACAAVIISAGVTMAPVLGVVAGVASLALLAADGRMLSFEVRGNQAGVTSLKDQAWYKWTEAVGPILLLPDLITSAPGALREMRALPGEVARLRASESGAHDAAAAARDEVGAFRESRAGSSGKDWAQRKLQRLRTRANKLTRALQSAQERLEAAQNKLRTLRTITVPAYAGSVYTHGLYVFDPPDFGQLGAASGASHPQAAPRSTGSVLDDTRYQPWRNLLPSNGAQSTVPYQLDLHLGVACKPEPAQQ